MYAEYEGSDTGLAGTVAVTIKNADGSSYAARTTAGITEPVAGSRAYHVADPDQDLTLTLYWDEGVGTLCAVETLYAGRGIVPAAVGSAMTLTSGERTSVANTVSGLATTGLAALKSLVDAVLLKTNTIGALAVTVTSPVAASGTITVYNGDDYASADSRAITVTVADSTHAMGLDDVDAVVKLKATQATWEAASVVSTTDGYTVTFEATAAQTAAVTRAQHYELEATLANGHVVTLARGSLLTRTDIPAVGAEA